MQLYHFLKRLFLNFVLEYRVKAKRYNLKMWYRRKIKLKIKKFKPPHLTAQQKAEIRNYYAKRGYKGVKTDWHRFFCGFNGQFDASYIPEDIYHPIIAMAVNNSEQWPALLDKNLSSIFFSDIKQPQTVVKNMGGIYIHNKEQITKNKAIELCLNENNLVIKPSIESGGGKHIHHFKLENSNSDQSNVQIEKIFNQYEKDFIVQTVLEQHFELSRLNPSSLNTVRILTYLRNDGVHVLSSHIRIGKAGSFTDNSSSGGISCGVLDDGQLKPYGFVQAGTKRDTTDSGTRLKDVRIPSYQQAVNMVKGMHRRVPYFRLIAWDIAIDANAEPVFIEYNTYRMGISSMQLTNGPLLKEFTDELLEIGRQSIKHGKS